MLYILKEMLKLFTSRREKVMLAVLVIMSFICAFLDLIGIGVFVPLIIVLFSPSELTHAGMLKTFFGFLRGCSKTDILIYASIILPLVFIAKNSIIMLNVAIQQRFAFLKMWNMQEKLFKLYLYAPYSFHLRRNSSHLMRNLQMIDSITLGVVTPAIIIVSELMVLAVLSVFVFWFNPKFFLFIAIAMGGFTLIFYMLIKRRMHTLGLRKMENKEQAILHINQGLGSIKEAIISGKEDYFLHEFSTKQKNVALISFEEHVYIRASNIYIETVMIVTVSAMIILALIIGLQAELILTSLSIFAIVAVRMIPSANRISTQVSMLRNGAPALHEILADIKYGTEVMRSAASCDAPEIQFNSEISLNSVTFCYEKAEVNVLNNISLKIKKNSMVGFAGTSGSGKTTLIDLILGLLEPGSGSITVDGVDIRKNINGWQRKLGYIPQNIYICDDSIKKNIAFGVEEDKIDIARLAEVIKMAQLDNFIEQLPQGADTVVGEHGARISGGERQRIGIARALYHQPEILIMDEATASLDNLTERAFMDAVNAISGKITIIIIAHRLTTLQGCDMIHFMQNNTIDSGSFKQLLQKNAMFRQMSGNDKTDIQP